MKRKIKVAVVGIGLMGSQHLIAIKNSKKADLHSIVDINERSRVPVSYTHLRAHET